MIVVMQVLLEMPLVVVKLQCLPDVLAVVIEGNGPLLRLFLTAALCLQVVLVQVFLHIFALLKCCQILLTE